MAGESIIELCKKEPLVPIGALTTAGILAYGLSTFRRGNIRQSQRAMRARVLAQGFTIIAVVAYGGYFKSVGRPAEEYPGLAGYVPPKE